MIQHLAAKVTLLFQRPLVIVKGVLFLKTVNGYFLTRNLRYLSSLESRQVNRCPQSRLRHHQSVNDTAYLAYPRCTSQLGSILAHQST
jgi:hypothetical protein